MRVTLQDIKNAQENIKEVVLKTDLVNNVRLSEKTGANVYYKCENLQRTGSFKIRGAFNKISSLTEEEKARGVIASSAGNHAQGVAMGAKKSGIKATIVMPAGAPLSKVSATKSYGAEVVLHGKIYDEAYAKAVEIQEQTGATFLHPYDDPFVIAGQGTIGLEIFEQLDGKVDAILCPIGGGGIISGIAVAAKSLNPNVKVIGVQTDNMPSMRESVKAGKVTSAFIDTTIADGICVKTPGNLTFEIVSEFVDEVVTVSENEIADAILFMMENQKIVSEGAGAVSTAAILSQKYTPKKDENVVCVVSGGNIDINTLYRIMNVALANSGRRWSFEVLMDDKPGNFAKVTSVIAGEGANLLNINQDMIAAGGYINKQIAEFVIETLDSEHIERIKNKIEEQGFRINTIKPM